ncbi:MAG: hypothetical protein M1828_000290 [Chrysothrix sp. TS-e1954]|nr:MAG: hypothetical protein M1828_000290 [Chrysothrix sp. TS-e1954]
MISRSVGLAAGFALAANAFMIPSTTSLKPEGFLKGMQQLTQPSSRMIKLACPGCSVPEAGAQIEGENSLVCIHHYLSSTLHRIKADISPQVLDFSLDDDHKALLLNGGHVYPGLPSPFTPATQTSSDTTFEELQEHASDVTAEERYLSFGSTLNSMVAADGTDSELVDISFQITALGDEAVNVDSLSIRLLKAEDGTLGIGDIVQVTPEESPSTPSMDDGEALFEIKPIDKIVPIEAKPTSCAEGMPTVMCRIRDMMVARLEALRQKAHNSAQAFDKQVKHGRPCPGMLRKPHLSGGVDKFADQLADKPTDGMPPRPHHGHHGHHRHHHMHHAVHRFMMGLRRIMFGFVIPVMIGVAAGMTASLVGMVFGTAIAWLWIRFVRKGKKGNASGRVRLEEAAIVKEDHDGVAEEKTGLMSDVEQSDEEAPPQYVEKD